MGCWDPLPLHSDREVGMGGARCGRWFDTQVGAPLELPKIYFTTISPFITIQWPGKVQR